MGSGLVADGLGFMFQDRGELFSLQDGHPNIYAPGKRPFQTIIPGFAAQGGRPWMSFGVMGGDMQPQGQTQIIINRVDYGLDIQAAGDSPALAPRRAPRRPWARTSRDLGPSRRAAPGIRRPEATRGAGSTHSAGRSAPPTEVSAATSASNTARGRGAHLCRRQRNASRRSRARVLILVGSTLRHFFGTWG